MSTVLSPQTNAAQERHEQLRRHLSTVPCFNKLWQERWTSRERAALGGNPKEAVKRHYNAIGMWMHLHQVNDDRAVIDLGESLGCLFPEDVKWLLKEFGEMPRDPEEAQDWAIQRGDLVLVRSSRSVFWDGEQLEVDWYLRKEQWDFLVIACEHAKRDDAIDRLSFGAKSAADIVTKKKNRLKGLKNFPSALVDHFQRVDTGTQKFTLPKDQIHIFD